MLSWRSFLVIAVVAGALMPLPARADVIIWNETVNGNFSNTQSTPTILTSLVSGDINSIIGSTGSGLIDWVTVRIPAGSTLNSVAVSSYTPGDPTSFVGFQGGTVFIGAFVEASFWGYTHFGTGPGNLNTNLLPEMNAAFGVQGFTIPLAAGDYAFAIRQAGLLTGYEFEFTVSPVPEPSSMVLIGLAGVGIAGRRWKKLRGTSR